MELYFYGNSENGSAERLAVGHPVPAAIRPDGPTGISFHPEVGIIAYATYRKLLERERCIWATGRWQFGILPAGSHSTLLHVGFKLDGYPELSDDHSYCAELHRLRSGGHDVREMAEEGLLLNAVLIDGDTKLVAALRQTRLSARMADALHGEFQRQATAAADYRPGLELFGAQAVLAATPVLTRNTCLAWEQSMPEA